jgi:hypothetical protein
VRKGRIGGIEMNDVDRKMAELRQQDKNFEEWAKTGFKKCSTLQDVNVTYSGITQNSNSRKSEIEAVRALGEYIGYGNMMEIASALWAEKLENTYGITAEGAFVGYEELVVVSAKNR